jgi:hypothetical protein
METLIYFPVAADRAVALSIPSLRKWADRIVEGAAMAEEEGRRVVHVTVDTWTAAMAPARAKEFARLLVEAADEAEAEDEEARRAEGYAPKSEDVQVTRDADGEITGMRKQLRY